MVAVRRGGGHVVVAPQSYLVVVHDGCFGWATEKSERTQMREGEREGEREREYQR